MSGAGMSNILHQNGINEKKLRILFIIIFMTMATIALWGSYLGADFSFINSSNSYLIDQTSFTPPFTAHRINYDRVGLNTYTHHFSLSNIDHIEGQNFRIIINRFTDNAIRVKLNGTIILSEGDMVQGRSMFKNGFVYGAIDRSLLKSQNILIIETYATYKSGMESSNVLITSHTLGTQAIETLDFFNVKLVLLGFGFLVFSSLFTFYIYYISLERDLSLVYCSLATLCATLYFMDYVKNVNLQYDYFLYKRLFLFGLCSSVGLYTLSIRKFVKSKLMDYSITAMILMFIGITFYSKDLIQYKSFYEYWYLVLVTNILIVLYKIAKNLKQSTNAFIYFIGFILLGSYSAYAVSIEFRGTYFILNSPLLYMVILATLPLLLGFDNITEKDRQIIREQELKEHAFINSITDNLTGAWNQRYLMMKLNEKKHNLIIGMIDFDDFKAINDTYGHLAGDHILKEVSKYVLKTIRKSDDLCRYGGDEFVLLLYDCTLDEAQTILEDIRQHIESTTFHYHNQHLSLTVSIGVFEDKEANDANVLLTSVDKALYEAKQAGKNFVSVLKTTP